MEENTNESVTACAAPVVQVPAQLPENGSLSHLFDPTKYRHLQLVAKDFAASEIVPKRYQGKPCDCLIALELAARLGVHPLMVMQNVYTVHGTPGMQGQFVIALVNSSGVFATHLEWEYSGEGDARTCTCKATRRADGKPVKLVMSIAIAKAEGWYAQNPKWKNIPDQMLAYRSASWLARLHCPEVLLGLQTVEEINDVIDITPLPKAPATEGPKAESRTEQVSEALAAKRNGAGKAVQVPQEDSKAPAPVSVPENEDTRPQGPNLEGLDLQACRMAALEYWTGTGWEPEDAERMAGKSLPQWTRKDVELVIGAARTQRANLAAAGL